MASKAKLTDGNKTERSSKVSRCRETPARQHQKLDGMKVIGVVLRKGNEFVSGSVVRRVR